MGRGRRGEKERGGELVRSEGLRIGVVVRVMVTRARAVVSGAVVIALWTNERQTSRLAFFSVILPWRLQSGSRPYLVVGPVGLIAEAVVAVA